jgi:hypothetical protein
LKARKNIGDRYQQGEPGPTLVMRRTSMALWAVPALV